MSDLLNKASLVVIPSGYKEDTVYSVVPSDGSGDLSFTRASNGTRINSAGLVEVCPWNLLEQSETFDNATWSKSGIAVTANASANPLTGLTNADNLVAENVTNFHYINQAITFTSDQYTISVYAKANGYSWFVIDTGLSNRAAYFNTTTGVVGVTGSSSTASIESVGNGWYKCVLSFTGIAGSSNIYLSVRNADNGGSFTGNGTGGILVYGAQLNIGSTAKPYFPTTDRLNVPRLTYQNGGGGCPSLLLEKQSTNVLSYSNTSDWGLSASITKTQNTTDLLSPDGTYNATKIVQSAGTGDTSQGFSIADGAITFSFWGRVASGTKTLVVDLRNNSGTVASLSPVLTTEWQRFTVTNSTSGTGSSGAVWIYPNGAGTFYIWGVQAEVGSYATSTILTNGSSATRVADACYKTGISSLIGQTEGVIFVDFVFNGYMQSIEELSLSANANNRIGMYTFDGTNTLRGYIVASGSVPFESNFISLTLGQRYKVAFAYKSGDCVVYINGVNVFANSSSFTFGATIDAYKFSDLYDTVPFYKPINQTTLFKTRLTNAELASLTTI